MTIAAVLALAVLLAPMPGTRIDPSLADIAACNEEAAERTTASALPGPERPEARTGLPPRREKTDPTGSILTDAADPLVRGMDAGRADDPAYRAAYRECMQERGSRSH